MHNVRIPLVGGFSTLLPSMDFETYSEAGLYRGPDGKIKSIVKLKPGLKGVGAAVYSEHPSTEVLSLAYDLRDGLGSRLWLPVLDPPEDLFKYIKQGGLIGAWNSFFEFLIWKNVCSDRMGWPDLPLLQLRDTASKSRAMCLPGALAKAGKALNMVEQKLSSGANDIKYFCVPRSHTKNNKSDRNNPLTDARGPGFYQYNIQDVVTESGIGDVLPDLSEFETKVFLHDQVVNARGTRVDTPSIKNLHEIISQAATKYNNELKTITHGRVVNSDDRGNLLLWLSDQGVHLDNLDKDTVADALTWCPSAVAVRVLKLRQMLSSSAVKKLPTMRVQTCKDGRIRGMYIYCGADKTGRASAGAVQPHNLPGSGTDLILCKNGCGHYYGANIASERCPRCGVATFLNPPKMGWTPDAIDDVLTVAQLRDLRTFEHHFGNAILAVKGCIRGMFIPGEGKDFICSDFSAIEAVVLAFMAGEQWRMEVFRTHGKIYEMSAAKISGVPFETILDHKRQTGEHHPLRKKLGKVAELASGYKGWVGAWKAFGADDYFTNDKDMKDAILKWRKDNPAIQAFWNGVESAFIRAVHHPAERFEFKRLKFGVADNRLYIQLPSGRSIIYHEARADPYVDDYGRSKYRLSYMRWNNSKKKGPVNQWIRVDTWVGELVENIIQAIARDIQMNSLLNLEAAGYHIVIHVHDESTAEVPIGFGSVEEFERIGSRMPWWCADWPIKMKGGWRGPRFKKG